MEMSVALFAYLGPETVLPLTSVVAAVAGVVLMFGRNTFRIAVRCVRRCLPGRTSKGARRPHLAARDRTRSGSRSSGPDQAA